MNGKNKPGDIVHAGRLVNFVCCFIFLVDFCKLEFLKAEFFEFV